MRRPVPSFMMTILVCSVAGTTSRADFVDGSTGGSFLLAAGVIENNVAGSLPTRITDAVAAGRGTLVGELRGEFDSLSGPSLAGLTKEFTLTSSGVDDVNGSGVGFHMDFGHDFAVPDATARLYTSSEHDATGYVAPGGSISISYLASLYHNDTAILIDSWVQEVSSPGAFSIPISRKELYFDNLLYQSYTIHLGCDIIITSTPGGGASTITLDPGLSVTSPSAVPETASIASMGIGVGIVLLASARRRALSTPQQPGVGLWGRLRCPCL